MGNINTIVDEITERVNELPPISGNTIQIMQLISNRNFLVKELVALISMDISLTSKILQIVNSASFGLSSPVSSIERAISFIGSRTILSIIVNDSLNDIYSSPLEGYIAEGGDFWEYSLRSAIASKLVAEHINESPDVAYTAGLLHDIGKAVIDGFLKKKREDNLLEKLNIGEEKDFIDIEKELLNTDHAIVGEQLAKKWGFPEILQIAIRFHHIPSKAPDNFKKLCMAVHFGELFAMLGGFGTGFDTLAYKIDKEAHEYVKLNRTQLAKVLLSIDSEFNIAKSKIGDNYV